MAQKLETGPMQIKHGHTDTHVFVGFGRVTTDLLLTPAQADAFIAALQNSKKNLAEHMATGQKLPNAG